MGKKLAIRGHLTRGKEVIELLEMMGGKNSRKFDGSANMYSYYIFNNIILSDRLSIAKNDDFEIFTLEEFLEKYPFKIGDKVYTKSNTEGTIIDIFWDGFKVLYQLSSANINALGYFHRNELKLYKENVNMELNKCTQCVYAVNNNHCGLRGFRSNFNVNYCSAQNTDKLPNGFELQEDGYFSWVNKKQKYPTTYEECCQHLGCDDKLSVGKLIPFQQLINARNAYWKIYGEEMGLSKSWEPEYDNCNTKYIISTSRNTIYKDISVIFNYILIFPTVEMRDEFYENFKDLIESCMKLL